MWRREHGCILAFAHADHQRHITREATEELKIDGFRALARMHNGSGELVSRNGNVFRGFAGLATWIAEHLRVESAVLDGEIACLDPDGRPNFRDLLFRQKECTFIAIPNPTRAGRRHRSVTKGMKSTLVSQRFSVPSRSRNTDINLRFLVPVSDMVENPAGNRCAAENP